MNKIKIIECNVEDLQNNIDEWIEETNPSPHIISTAIGYTEYSAVCISILYNQNPIKL